MYVAWKLVGIYDTPKGYRELHSIWYDLLSEQYDVKCAENIFLMAIQY